MTTTTMDSSAYGATLMPGYEPLVWYSKNGKPTSAMQTPYLTGTPALSNANNGSVPATSTPSSDLDALFQMLTAMSTLEQVVSEEGEEDDDGGGSGFSPMQMMLPVIFASLAEAAASSGAGGTGAAGDSNVAAVSGGNPAGIAQSVRGQSAASLMENQDVPMDRGVPTTECCANFVSACLEKAGLLPASEHSNSVATLYQTLKNRGWRNVSRSQAKPGDVCIVGGDQHVELVASNKNGRITLIGSNNPGGGPVPQVVSYDTSTGNAGDVQFLSPP